MKKFLFVILFASIFSQIQAQQFTTKGKEFWFVYMQNYYNPTPYVYISSDVATSGVISIPLQGWSQNFTVTPGAGTQIVLPFAICTSTGSGNIQNFGVRIQTLKNVNAYLLNYGSGTATADASLILPTPTLGEDYFVTAYKDYAVNYSAASEICMVAAYNGTTIQITPSAALTSGQPAGVPFSVTLNAGQVYQIQSNADLTGTRVTSSGITCKKFAVFGGNVCSGVACGCCCDHLVEQMYPTETWGKRVVAPPLATRASSTYRVLASTNGTQFTINGGAPITLNAGQFWQGNLGGAPYFDANLPISVMQYSQSAQCDGTSSDPFMILMSPVEQTLTNVRFNAFTSSVINSYYLNVVTKSNSTSTVSLDGNNISAFFFPVPSNPLYSYAQLSITQGNHTLLSDSGFNAYVYGYGSYESFGYAAGANLANLFARIEYASVNFDSIICPDDTIQFLGIGDTSIVSYEWTFGNGNSSTIQNPVQTFSSLGDYPIEMIVLRAGQCDKDTIRDTVRVRGPEVVNIPDDTICLGESITISTSSGGQLFWSTGATSTSSITINPSSTTQYSVYSQVAACPGIPDTFTIQVFNPDAGFNSSSGCQNAPILFEPSFDQNIPIQSFQWNFGDGSISNVDTVTHTYVSPGNYPISLILTTPFGCADTAEQIISILPESTASFAANPVCNGTPMSFSNNSIVNPSPIIANWNFGDGNSSTLTNPSHVYADTGLYNVTLIVYPSGGCADTVTQTVQVNYQPQALFSANPACEQQNVNFLNSSISSGSATYFWYWGDNQVDSNGITSHTFSLPGTYITTLIVRENNGCSDTANNQITIYPLPVASFTAGNTCNGTPAQLNNNSTIASGSFTSAWSLGDGSSSTLNSPSHLYAGTGTYTIQLITTDQSGLGCADTIQQSITVFTQPVALFQATDHCDQQSVAFTNQSTFDSLTLWNWSLGDGTTSTLFEPQHTYPSPGSFSPTLIASGPGGCADTSSLPITIYPLPIASFTAGNTCDGLPVLLNNTTTIASGSFTSAWSLGDGNTSTLSSPSYTYPDTGSYSVSLIVTSSQFSACADSITQNVTINYQPAALFSITPACANSPAIITNGTGQGNGETLSWIFGDGQTASGNPANHIYSTAGNYNVVLMATTPEGCSDQDTALVTIYPNPVTQFSAQDHCLGTTLSVSNQSSISSGIIATQIWDLGNGIIQSASPSGNVFNSPGTYFLELVNISNQGCTDSLSLPVTVWPLPELDFVTTTACFGEANGSATVSVSSGTPPYSINWENGQYSTTINQQFAGMYTATVSDQNNCTQSDSVYIPQQAQPVLFNQQTDTFYVNLGEEVTLSVSTNYDPVTYHWSPLAYFICPDCEENTIAPISDITYQITAENELGCQGQTTLYVMVNPEYLIFVPNVFSPNGDGNNDLFEVKSKAVKQFEMKIFNRIGELVYRSNNVTDGWDGTYKGSLQSPGVFVWLIDIVYIDNHNRSLKGSVTLIR